MQHTPRIKADDSSLTATGETPAEIQNKLRRGIQNVSTWLSANKITLNETKTEYMLIGSIKRSKQIKNDPVIKIKDHVIRRIYSKKVLGLEIDYKSKSTNHVEAQSKKIYRSIAMLRKFKALCTPSNITDDVQVICPRLFQLLFRYMV